MSTAANAPAQAMPRRLATDEFKRIEEQRAKLTKAERIAKHANKFDLTPIIELVSYEYHTDELRRYLMRLYFFACDALAEGKYKREYLENECNALSRVIASLDECGDYIEGGAPDPEMVRVIPDGAPAAKEIEELRRDLMAAQAHAREVQIQVGYWADSYNEAIRVLRPTEEQQKKLRELRAALGQSADRKAKEMAYAEAHAQHASTYAELWADMYAELRAAAFPLMNAQQQEFHRAQCARIEEAHGLAAIHPIYRRVY